MIALDTNVLVRFLVDSADEPSQSERARALVKATVDAGQEVYVPLVALVETVWVLRKAGGFGRGDIARTVRGLLAARSFVMGERARVEAALEGYEAGKGDFADHVIREDGRAAGAMVVYTFDRALHGQEGFQEP